MSEKLTVRQFFQRFPDEDTCLDHVMTVRFGKRFTCPGCQADATFHRIATRKAYSCSYCGHHIYPCAGTIFQDSRTPLQSWFYAIYLFVTTRHGVSGMELHRVLGVTKKTGWRMGQQIRKLIGSTEGVSKLLGHVELDEAYVGGKRSGGKRGRGAPGKTIVMGMAERGGRVRAEVIPNVQKETLRGVTPKNVEAGSTVSTDELRNTPTTTTATARRTTPIRSRASGGCSRRPCAGRTFISPRSIWTATSTSSRSGRAIAR